MEHLAGRDEKKRVCCEYSRRGQDSADSVQANMVRCEPAHLRGERSEWKALSQENDGAYRSEFRNAVKG